VCGPQSIEAQLVEMLQRRSLAYQLQDLVCGKCGEVKADNTQLICSTCSGKFQTKILPDEFKRK
jgi:DNA polymerase epsilon subunit 1